MSTTLELRPAERLINRFSDWFDMPDLFDRFERMGVAHPMRIEEERTADALVIRAEMPGLDPDRDVDIEVSNGVLRVRAERREEDRKESNGTVTSEFHYGTFTRVIPVPRSVTAESISATYKDGILSISVPVPQDTTPTASKVPVSRL
jgi:HSP20 family protein